MEEVLKEPVFDSFSESNSREGSLRAGSSFGKPSPAIARLLACPEDAATLEISPTHGARPALYTSQATCLHDALKKGNAAEYVLNRMRCLLSSCCLCLSLCRGVPEPVLHTGVEAQPEKAGSPRLSTAEIARRACEAQGDSVLHQSSSGWFARSLHRPSFNTFNSASSFELSTAGKPNHPLPFLCICSMPTAMSKERILC